ncbi:serine/threonine-protein kinase [Paracoccaceae bacterium]|nr:serine/threonine-protein kinase [Paracoccaceae bacterium]
MTNSKDTDIFQTGDLLNNTYRIEGILGRGGTSEVYKARSEISKRVVALKALRTEFSMNDDYLVLMTREEAIREIRHDSIVRYYDNQRMPDGRVYLIMDYVEGPGLDKKMREGGMSADDLLIIAKKVSAGLNAAHKKNIVHRDLSPDNIILRNGDANEPVIIDFGIAKDSNPGAETIVGNEFAGKYAYAAPEQLSGKTDARSDLYALGAMLLSTFRGKAPDMGNNPMDVVNIKGKPLNTEGVPEPLKALIDKMTNPDPSARFQSAEELLLEIDPDFEKTIVYKPSKNMQVNKTSEEKKSTNKAPKKKSGVLIPILLVLVLISGGGISYFSGFLDSFLKPNYPTADPFTLVISEDIKGKITARGFVPSQSALERLSETVNVTGGKLNLTLASGAISKTWAEDINVLTGFLSTLDEFNLDITDNSAKITGYTENNTTKTKLIKILEDENLFKNLIIDSSILLGSRNLTLERIYNILADFENCGALTLLNVPKQHYSINDKIIVTGRIENKTSRKKLLEEIKKVAGERKVSIQTEVLNKSLCLIDETLTNIPSGGFDIIFGFGSDGSLNPGGRYFVGDNPTIDVTIPKSITNGYLYVSILDVTGSVFHLLPNMNRSNNQIQDLKQQSGNEGAIRVAYSLKESKDRAKPAFLIDDSTLGQSKIIIIHSKSPLFESLRPSMESIEGYVSALTGITVPISALDSRILITAKPGS